MDNNRGSDFEDHSPRFGASPDAGTGAAAGDDGMRDEEFATERRAGLGAAYAALKVATAVVEDDGSLQARLWDRPGLADAILGRVLLDPFDRGADGAALADAGLPAPVAALLDVRGPVSVADLDATIQAIGEVFTTINRLEALAAVLLERARVQAQRAHGALLDESDPNVRAASWERRGDLARRALVADLAHTLRHTETAVSTRLTEAQALVARAPRTLAAAMSGAAVWRNAAKVADTVTDLDPATADRLDAAVVGAARCQNPTAFTRTVRRVREQVHPTPAQVRHEEAATKRYVTVLPAADGMAYLTLFAPAPAVHAIHDRLVQVGVTARSGGDPRTQDQLRTDTMCALLLDDGTLDLTTVTGDRDTTADTTTSPPGATGSRTGSDPDSGEDSRPATAFSNRFSLAALARSVRPKIYVTVPVLTLLGRIDEPALLDGTVPIDPDTARELAGLASSFTRLLTHPVSGEVLTVDRHTYRPPADLRHLVKVRDTTCRFPGCTRRAQDSDTDHTTAHARGGRTSAPSLAALCRRHHTLKHQTRYSVTQSPTGDGTLTWTTPTSRTCTTYPDTIPTTIHKSTTAGRVADDPPF